MGLKLFGRHTEVMSCFELFQRICCELSAVINCNADVMMVTPQEFAKGWELLVMFKERRSAFRPMLLKKFWLQGGK